MGKFRAYVRSDVVECRHCGKQLRPASDGYCLMFGDGNGNYEQLCGCGPRNKTYYDIVATPAERDAHNSQNQVSLDALAEALGGKPGKEGPGQPMAREASVFDLPEGVSL